MNKKDIALGIIPGPVYQDKCGHPPGAYIASFECMNFKTLETRQYDLYVESSNRTDLGQSICIRHSNDDPDYSGFPGITFLMDASKVGLEYCQFALAILLDKGRIVWQPNAEKPQ